MDDSLIVVLLLALAGFLAGGVYSLWKTAKLIAIVLAVGAALAVAAAITWTLG